MEFGIGQVQGQRYFWIDDGFRRMVFDQKGYLGLLREVCKAYEVMGNDGH